MGVNKWQELLEQDRAECQAAHDRLAVIACADPAWSQAPADEILRDIDTTVRELGQQPTPGPTFFMSSHQYDAWCELLGQPRIRHVDITGRIDV